jgi:hypothetical protein
VAMRFSNPKSKISLHWATRPRLPIMLPEAIRHRANPGSFQGCPAAIREFSSP